MDEKEKLKALLSQKLAQSRSSRARTVTPRQVDEVSEGLLKEASRKRLRELSESIVGDPDVFASTDMSDIDTILDEIKNKKKP